MENLLDDFEDLNPVERKRIIQATIAYILLYPHRAATHPSHPIIDSRFDESNQLIGHFVSVGEASRDD